MFVQHHMKGIIYLINRFKSSLNTLKKINFHMFVIDEAHRIKREFITLKYKINEIIKLLITGNLL